MGNNALAVPFTDKHTVRFTAIRNEIQAAATGLQGWRREMEDEYVLTELPSLVDHILVGVFDGHGGSGAAKYASKHLASVLEQTDEWRRYAAVENREHYIDVLKQAMLKAFSELDDRLRHQQMNSNQASDTGGCTAVIALITPHFIVCANAGDSRCILGCGGTMIPLSNDHKPNDPEERARVIRAGGIVINNRVQNTLAVSRALGDFKYKSNQQLPPSQQMVSCVPDIVVHSRQASDEILLLACDGLWDVMTNEAALRTCYEVLEKGEHDMGLLAEEMTDVAFALGSTDNISVVVVRLPGMSMKLGPIEGGGVRERRRERDEDILAGRSSDASLSVRSSTASGRGSESQVLYDRRSGMGAPVCPRYPGLQRESNSGIRNKRTADRDSSVSKGERDSNSLSPVRAF